MSIDRRAAGMTLVELVVAIVIIGVGLAGILAAFSTLVRGSSDPVVHKQMLAIAEGMMEEITLKPFAPPATPALPANVLADCTSGLAKAPRSLFDDLRDYTNYQTTGICNMDGDAVPSLSSYNLAVAIDPAATLGALGGGNVIRITVTVTHGGDSIVLTGWRTHYAAGLP